MYNRSCLLGFGAMSLLAGAFYAGCSYWIYTHTQYLSVWFSVAALLLAIAAVSFGIGMIARYRQVMHL